MARYFFYAAYGWLLITGILHFSIDVLSQYLRGKRSPGAETTLYYGLNSAYALGQVLFALCLLLMIRNRSEMVWQWPGLLLAFAAAVSWFLICHFFLEYREPKMMLSIFSVLLIIATSLQRFVS
jgi:hypothetical protein